MTVVALTRGTRAVTSRDPRGRGLHRPNDCWAQVNVAPSCQ
jgi:hypothetical protein